MKNPGALTPAQLEIVRRPPQEKTFLEGPAGCGKTTAGVERMLTLMQQGAPGSAILLLLPQRTLAQPYQEALNLPGAAAGGLAAPTTAGGLAQRMVELFWPLAAETAGFARPDQPPTFLTLETAQYFLARLARPLLEEGYFDTITIERNRLYSQILDNLNKAALTGLDYRDTSERLKLAWGGEPAHKRVYDDAQQCANLFRRFCLEHNLLDFSLQIEVFWRYLWPLETCRGYLSKTYRHLIYDNVEEDTPFAHDLIRDWLPAFDSALLIYDHDGGYRRFLGADPQGGYALRALCQVHILLEQSFVVAPPLLAFGERLAGSFAPQVEAAAPLEPPAGPATSVVYFQDHRFYPQMLDWVAEQTAALVHEAGTPPEEIALLAPYLSDALRFSLINRLENRGVPVRAHRPSRALRDEPATHCLLTLAALAHPAWGFLPTRFDAAYAFLQAFAGMDLVRAQLLAEIVLRQREGRAMLAPFDGIKGEMQERITYLVGLRYERLRLWLQAYAEQEEEMLDVFLSRLFGEVLSQPGFGFHSSFSGAEVAARLIESVQKFRWAVGGLLVEQGVSLGQEYLAMVKDGVIAAQYVQSWHATAEGAVLIAPAHTFLMLNRPAEYQFWLDIGSQGWFERLLQPLTHPHVLSRGWPAGQVWTDEHEQAANQETLRRLSLGLIRRCGSGVFLGLCEMGEQGFEQRGPLLLGLRRALSQSRPRPAPG
jgi:hypothetical protein